MKVLDKNKSLNFLKDITKNDGNTYYIKNLLDIYPNVINLMLEDITPDLSKVKYVKKRRYEQLKNKVLEQKDLLILNFKLKDLFPFALLEKLKKYYCDYFKASDVLINYIVKQLITQPYSTLCQLKGIGFIKADKILLNANFYEDTIWTYDLRSSVQRCTSFIIWYLINQLVGSTYVNISDLKRIMIYKYGLDGCVKQFDRALQDNKLTMFDNDKIMLTTAYLEEYNISKFIKHALLKTSEIHYDINIDKYKNIESFTLSEDQLKILELVNKYQLILLNGYAGTGKSSSIKALINMLEDNNKTYKILAPTAKAAKQISIYTNRPASTIHYLLCKDMPNFDNGVKDRSEYEQAINIDFVKSKSDEYLDYDIIIIDETSMLSIQLFNILIKYINPEKTKLLLIGDSYQLPSIQSGNLYQDLLDIENIPKITLNKIFRYNEDGLITVATNIRLGKKYLTDATIQKIGNSYEFHQFDNVPDMINGALNKYVELLSNGDSIQDIAILTAKNIGNSGTNIINSCIQKIINPIDEFDDTIAIKIDNQTIRFKENDIVMNIKNNYNAKPLNDPEENKVLIANGQIGTVKCINVLNNTMIVEIDNDKFEFNYEDICNLRLAYCFTVHKAQGSQFKNVIYLTSNEDMFMTNSNLLYVAVTRAQTKCYHYGARHVINYKINEKENLKRNTTLKLQYKLI